MAEYANENYTNAPSLQHIEASLQMNDTPLGRNGFKVVNLHTQNNIYELHLGGKVLRGGLDGAVIPYGVAKMAATKQLRCGVEIKHSEAHKAQYREKHGFSVQGTERIVEFSGAAQGQALIETLAAAVYAEYPEVLLLQSSFDHSVILLLSQGIVRVWQQLSFDAAIWKMSDFLQ
eukprot:GHRR01009647.1.p1 GENE.GHRR01009647.1~~GHRR01009647.1.p1  ORF type:complete len:175 (+),score=59.74 GHRR01009647.1:514-1038(+)